MSKPDYIDDFKVEDGIGLKFNGKSPDSIEIRLKLVRGDRPTPYLVIKVRDGDETFDLHVPLLEVTVKRVGQEHGQDTASD